VSAQAGKTRKKSTTLFQRIMTGLTFPLFMLAAIFMALQLTSEMRAVNQAQQATSRLALHSIYQNLAHTLETGAGPEALGKTIAELQKFHTGISIALFDLLNREILVAGDTPWAEFDRQAVENALLEKKDRGRPFLVRVNRELGKLTAYIPLGTERSGPVYVARLHFPLANLGTALANSRMTLLVILAMITGTGIAIGLRLAKSIVRPIQTLHAASREIVKGNLGMQVDIRTGDEIEMLARTFNEMSEALKTMKQQAVDSNPLTGLPGNQGIFRELKHRIHERQKFVLFHIDLDRFKVFNDHFGLAKGDEAIKATAEILARAPKAAGTGDDFVGHQGGDDFVYLTRPAKAREVAEFVIREFDDKAVRALYKPEDIKRGYILQIDRRHLAETGEERMVEFPLLAISLAGVSSVKRDFADYFDCMSMAVTVKKEVKKDIRSSYIIKE
jgi:diguanylate cyclase (GGDEF)-like protein